MLPSPDSGILKLTEKREKCCASELDDDWFEVLSVRRLMRKRLIRIEGCVWVLSGVYGISLSNDAHEDSQKRSNVCPNSLR